MIPKNLAHFRTRKLPQRWIRITVHDGLPDGCCRRLKLKISKATLSPSKEHFLTFISYWDTCVEYATAGDRVFVGTFQDPRRRKLFPTSRKPIVAKRQSKRKLLPNRALH